MHATRRASRTAAVEQYRDAFQTSAKLANNPKFLHPGTRRHKNFPMSFDANRFSDSWGETLDAAEHNLRVINRDALSLEEAEAYDSAVRTIHKSPVAVSALFNIPARVLKITDDFSRKSFVADFTRDLLDTLIGAMTLEDFVLESEELVRYCARIIENGVPKHEQRSFMVSTLPYISGDDYDRALVAYSAELENFERGLEAVWILAAVQEATLETRGSHHGD